MLIIFTTINNITDIKQGDAMSEVFSPKSMNFYFENWESGTVHMDATQRGLYISLLCHEWKHGCIPLDVKTIARIGGLEVEQIDGCKYVFDKFFIYDSKLFNKKIERVRHDYWEASKAQSKKAQTKHEKRGKKVVSNVIRHPNIHIKGCNQRTYQNCQCICNGDAILIRLIKPIKPIRHKYTQEREREDSPPPFDENKYSLLGESVVSLISKFHGVQGLRPDDIIQLTSMYPKATSDDGFMTRLAFRVQDDPQARNTVDSWCANYGRFGGEDKSKDSGNPFGKKVANG